MEEERRRTVNEGKQQLHLVPSSSAESGGIFQMHKCSHASPSRTRLNTLETQQALYPPQKSCSCHLFTAWQHLRG